MALAGFLLICSRFVPRPGRLRKSANGIEHRYLGQLVRRKAEADSSCLIRHLSKLRVGTLQAPDGEHHRVRLADRIGDQAFGMQPVEGVPVERLPGPPPVVQAQQQQRQHGVVDAVVVDLHGVLRVARERARQARKGHRPFDVNRTVQGQASRGFLPLRPNCLAVIEVDSDHPGWLRLGAQTDRRAPSSSSTKRSDRMPSEHLQNASHINRLFETVLGRPPCNPLRTL